MSRTRELRRLARRLIRLGFVIAAVLVAGTIAFSISEHLNPWEGFRWSLDVVATVGSLEHPKTTAGEITSTLLIIVGVGTLFYALVTVTEFFVSGNLAELLQERRAQRMIDVQPFFFRCLFHPSRRCPRPLSRPLVVRVRPTQHLRKV